MDDIDIFGYNLGGSVSEMMNPVERELPSLSPAQIANMGAAFADPLGMVDITGEYPEFPAAGVSMSEMVMEGPRSPSLIENLSEGSYGAAALQGIGMIPVVGGAARAARNLIKGADRLEKAKKAGFDTETVYYHGTDSDITEFRMPSRETGQTKTVGTGVFMSSSPEVAGSYAKENRAAGKSPSIYPVYINKQEFLRVRPADKGQMWSNISTDGLVIEFPDGTTKPANEVFKLEEGSTNTDELSRIAKSQGRKGLIIEGVVDAGTGTSGEYRYATQYLKDKGYDVSLPIGTTKESFDKMQAVPSEIMEEARLYAKAQLYRPADVVVSFDPKNIRSVNAEFEDFDTADISKAKGGEIRKFSKGGILDLIVKGDFDPRFDPRKREQEMLRNLEAEIIGSNYTQPMPRLALSDLEGEGFVTSMTDRTRAGGDVKSINRVQLVDPIHLPGGQDFMFNNPSAVWASAEMPSSQILEMARDLKSQSGKDPLYIPWRMAPSGGDFSTTTGELMLGYAAANMTKATKKALDKAMRSYRTTGSMVKGKRVGAGRKIEGWKGLDDPSSVAVWRNTPDAVRKELMNMMDVQFRNKGGLSIGAARLINADPKQLTAKDAGIQNVGRIFADIDIFDSAHPSYPFAVPGGGVGVLENASAATAFDLLPKARFGDAQKKVKDPANPTQQEIRALQMKPYGGTITEDILRRMEARGVDVNSIAGLTGGALTFTLLSAGLVTPQEVQAGALKEFANNLRKADEMGLKTDQILYHGSTFDIEEFVPSSATDNDFGQGTYLTISPSDASRNYAGEGPDLTNRINTLSESIQESLEGSWSFNADFWDKINDPEVSAKIEKLVDEFEENRDRGVLEEAADLAAKTILKGQNEGVIYPVFVNNNDFAIIGGKNRTVIDIDREQYYESAREEINRSDFGSDDDYEEAVFEYAEELENSDYESPMQSLRDTLTYAGASDETVSNVMNEVLDRQNEIDLTEINDIIRNSYNEDWETGEILNNGQIMQNVLTDLGYKGVVDNTAGQKFAGMGSGGMHTIVFPGNENLIRSINAKFDPAKADSPNILASAPPILAPIGGATILAATALSAQEAQAGGLGSLKTAIDKSREQSLKQAKEQGYNLDNVMYHASKQDIDEFVPGYDDGLVFLTPNKEFANNWLGKGRFKERQDGTGAIEGVRAEIKQFNKEANEILESLPEDQASQYYREVLSPKSQQLRREEREADSAIYPVVTKTKKPFVPSKDVDVLEELYGKEYLEEPFGSGFATFRDAMKDGNYLLYENKQVVDFLKSKGFDSMFLKENSGADQPFTTLAVFNPSDIRSVNAKFDPKEKGSPKILASVPFAAGIGALGSMQEARADALAAEGAGTEVILDALSGIASPIAGGAAGLMQYTSPLGFLLGREGQGQRIREARETVADALNYEPRSELAKEMSQKAQEGIAQLAAPVVKTLEPVVTGAVEQITDPQNVSPLGLLYRGGKYLYEDIFGEPEREATKSAMDVVL